LTYPGARLIGVCDVDDRHLQQALDMTDDEVEGHKDYREVLQRKYVDVVHIATPPHWHGIIAKEAAEAGKDVWWEKPMTRTIGGGPKLGAAVQRNGSIFRLHTWFRVSGVCYGIGRPANAIKQ